MEKSSGYKALLQEAVEILKWQGTEYAGTLEGQCPWQTLNGIKNMAEVLEIPLSEIGLEDYDIDAILNGKRSDAAGQLHTP